MSSGADTQGTAGIAITGGHGFLGWHTACRLRALHGVEAVRLTRNAFVGPEAMRSAIAEADTVIHLAGVNRGDTPGQVEQGNIDLAETLGAAIRANGRPVHVAYGDSIQSEQDSHYGRGKAKAAEILGDAVAAVGGTLADVVLPNLFGEHGRPNYNSFVATFCHALATGDEPEVQVDSVVPLLHAQDAAAALISAADRRESHVARPAGAPHKVSEVLAHLIAIRDTYATGEIPPLTDKFSVDLFNTYRSFLFPDQFPIHPSVHSDPRGDLFETVRSHGGTGMAFVSTTKPGMMRGDHYHLNKVERFFVVSGEAEIALRRLYDDGVVRFRLSGAEPGFVDMPTMWVHNITNVGEQDLVTVFWADQLLDLEDPDQYPERVEQGESQS